MRSSDRVGFGVRVGRALRFTRVEAHTAGAGFAHVARQQFCLYGRADADVPRVVHICSWRLQVVGSFIVALPARPDR